VNLKKLRKMKLMEHEITQVRDFCSYSWRDVFRWFQTGWAEGVKEMSFRTDAIHRAIGEENGYSIEYDVTGDYIDVGQFIEGVPECFGQVTTQEMPREEVRIMVATMGHCGIHQDQFYNKGAAITALIDQLKRTHFVTLDLVCDASGICGHKLEVTFHIDMKNDYSRDLIAFCLANSGFLRRIWFAIAERTFNCSECGAYGTPADREKRDKNVIYFGKIERNEWTSIEDATRRVQASLDGILKREC